MRDLFGYPMTRTRDPETSRLASRIIEPKLGTLYWGVLETLRDNGPLCHVEIARLMGKREGSISPRMKPLRQAGLVALTGEMRRPPNAAPGEEYKITREGLDVLMGVV